MFLEAIKDIRNSVSKASVDGVQSADLNSSFGWQKWGRYGVIFGAAFISLMMTCITCKAHAIVNKRNSVLL